MKLISKYIFLFYITLFSLVSAGAQVTLIGKIIDSHTKEPVPYASVYLKTSSIGQTADSAGNFTIHINNLEQDSLLISYVGYQPFKLHVTDKDDNRPLDIQLERGALSNTVVIKAKFNKGLCL